MALAVNYQWIILDFPPLMMGDDLSPHSVRTDHDPCRRDGEGPQRLYPTAAIPCSGMILTTAPLLQRGIWFPSRCRACL
jgi:hypothetical protein